MKETRRCTYCDQEKPLTAFSPNQRGDHMSRCKPCRNKMRRGNRPPNVRSDPWAIPTKALGPIVKEWLDSYDTEALYLRTRGSRAHTGAGWQMGDKMHPLSILSERVGKTSRWLYDIVNERAKVISFANADALLGAMDATHEWHGRLADVYPQPRKKRVFKDTRWTLAEIEFYHGLVLRGLPKMHLAKEIYESKGYASAASCVHALCLRFDRHGFLLPDRNEMIRRARSQHGMLSGAKAARERGDMDEYRRLWREYQRTRKVCRKRQCDALTSPKMGRPKARRCLRYALNDSTFCLAHDPRTRDANAENLANVAALRVAA